MTKGWRVLRLVSPLIMGMAVLLVPSSLQAQSTSSPGATPPPSDAQQKPAATTPAAQNAAGPSAQEIANQSNNPAAPVTLIQFRDILLPNANAPGVVPNLGGASGMVNSLQVQPVLPIGPFESFPHVQLVKVTMPIAVSVSGSSPTQQFNVNGVGDLQVFDLLVFKRSWGSWGLDLHWCSLRHPRISSAPGSIRPARRLP